MGTEIVNPTKNRDNDDICNLFRKRIQHFIADNHFNIF